jgi:internalin A
MKNNCVLILGLVCLAQLASCGSRPSSEEEINSQPIVKSFVQWCQQKDSVSAAAKLTIDLLLKEADTNNCQLADTKLRSLTSLDLYHSQITDLGPLAGFNNLTNLDLIGNQISDLKPLANLSKLTFLSLTKNKITDVTPLAKLSKLTFLGLSHNQISDLKPLANLSDLLTLNLSGNQLAEEVCPVKPANTCSF